MLVLRPVNENDLQALLRMSIEVGSGMTTMPNDEGTWVERIALSKKTFAQKTGPEEESVFFLVAEDTVTGEVVGTTAIYNNVGSKTPFFTYKISLITQYSELLEKNVRNNCLFLVNDFTGKTEIGTLFLTGDYRHSSYGQFLSRSRYLLLSDFPDLFSDTVIAELRGWQDKEGNSPFWQALGKRFFDLPFENADHINAIKGSQFIADLMPKYPVYVELLPDEAQSVIGKPHEISAAAVNLLKKEGFYTDNYVDIFDGGPTYQCRRNQIKSVRDCNVYQAKRADHSLDQYQRYIISNKNVNDYRIVIQTAEIYSDGTVGVSQDVLDYLHIKEGDSVTLLAMKEKKQ